MEERSGVNMDYTTSEIAKKWGITAAHVSRLCKEGRIPGAEFVGNHWRIPEGAEKPKKYVTAGFLTALETAKKWGISANKVEWMCLKGMLPNAERGKRTWIIPEDTLNPLEGYIAASEIAKKWGLTADHVTRLCREGRIPGAAIIGGRWRIPKDTEKPKKYVTAGFLTASETAKKWGISANKVEWMCLKGMLPNVERGKRTWFIPEDTVNPLEGYIAASKMADRWGANSIHVRVCCRERRIPGAKCVGRKWYIPVETQKPADGRTRRLPGHVSAKKAAEKWNVSLSFVCKVCREGRIPGTEFIDGTWNIPEDAVCPEKQRGKRREHGIHNDPKNSR